MFIRLLCPSLTRVARIRATAVGLAFITWSSPVHAHRGWWGACESLLARVNRGMESRARDKAANRSLRVYPGPVEAAADRILGWMWMAAIVDHPERPGFQRLMATREGANIRDLVNRYLIEEFGFERGATARAARVALWEGRDQGPLMFVVHQRPAWQGPTAELLRLHWRDKHPAVVLASEMFRAQEPELLDRATLLQYSAGGELPGPVTGNDFTFVGGFCHLCMANAVRESLVRAGEIHDRVRIAIYADLTYLDRFHVTWNHSRPDQPLSGRFEVPLTPVLLGVLDPALAARLEVEPLAAHRHASIAQMLQEWFRIDAAGSPELVERDSDVTVRVTGNHRGWHGRTARVTLEFILLRPESRALLGL